MVQRKHKPSDKPLKPNEAAAQREEQMRGGSVGASATFSGGSTDPGADSGLYPMRLVSRLTGLSADTIRAWERRYSAIEPRRSSGNTRRFSAMDVRRLVLLRDAVARGHSIGTIAHLSIEQLEDLAGESGELLTHAPAPQAVEESPASDGEVARTSDFSTKGAQHEELLQEYLAAVSRFDARRAHDLLLRAAAFLDRRELIFDVIVPLIQEIGRRWSHGEIGVAQEHMVSAQIRGVLSSMLRFSPPTPGTPRLLLTTPPGHRHEFGVLVAGLLAASRGLDPVYLGPDLPFDELNWAIRMSQAKIVILGIVRDLTPREAQELPVSLELMTRNVDVWVGLPEDHVLVSQFSKVRAFHDFESFDQALDMLASKRA